MNKLLQTVFVLMVVVGMTGCAVYPLYEPHYSPRPYYSHHHHDEFRGDRHWR